METEAVKWALAQGIGGVLAGIIFLFYRKDVANYTELWKGQSDALLAVVKDNTTAITKLAGIVDELNRRLAQSNRNEQEKGRWRSDSAQK